MFEHQERVAILLLIGVAVTVIAAHLVLASVGKQPFSVPYTNQSADGELVIFSGCIDQVTVTKTGGHLLLYVDNVTVFVPGPVAGDRSFEKGTNLTLYGTVQTFHGTKELVVNSAGDIRFLP